MTLAKPSYRERSRCKFWLALTGAHRKFESFGELGWGLMNARSRPFAAGNLCRRMMPRAAPFRRGSPSRWSSGFSRQFFGNGVAFSLCPTTSPKTNLNLTRRPPPPAVVARRASEPESAFWIRRSLPRGRLDPSPQFLLPCCSASSRDCSSRDSPPRLFSCCSPGTERLMKTAKIALALLFLLAVSSSSEELKSFRDVQWKYPRVRTASKEKDEVLRQRFKEKGLAYPPRAILLRAFKQEGLLELWAADAEDKRFVLVHEYRICTSSGTLGPKRRFVDEQFPEGFYDLDWFNPQSNFYLSLHINYPK